MRWMNGHIMRLLLIGFIGSGFLGRTSICSASQYFWTQKTDILSSRYSHTSAVVNGKIYIIGGMTSGPNARALSTVEEYDAASDTWTRKTDMPTARGWMSPSSPVVAGKIYVVGGWSGSNSTSTLEEYDPITDTWTRKTNMPTRRDSIATVVFDGKIYAIGGCTNNLTGLSVVEQYDPVTDTWTRDASMPVGVWGPSANVVNEKIYVLGGRPRTTAIPNVYEYDPAIDTWTRKADMPVAAGEMASVIFGNRIAVIGGFDLGSPHTAVQMYDPEIDSWMQEADTPFRRAHCSASVVNNRIYVIGGTDRPFETSPPATSSVYVYDVIVDFNRDGIVDSKDVCMMVEHWGTDEPLYDISPMPWGDGVVDVQDLIMLTEYLFEAVKDPTLIAHWALDETEGDIAYDASDSVGENDAVVFGDALWQPVGGMIAGALQLDGIDDYVSAPFVLNPGIGRFSVFAWVRNGAPGQVIISQTSGANWLSTDSANGHLMTELKGLVKGPQQPLWSRTPITDGDWHRIGFVRDTPERILYVDGVEVARDMHTSLTRSEGGLHLGAGKNLGPSSFWSGLIDDVRIYNVALSADEVAALAQ